MSARPGSSLGRCATPATPRRAGALDLTYRVHRLDERDDYSAHTVKNRRIELGYFIDWCEERSITRPDEVTRALLERYRQHVFRYRRKDNGTPLSFQTQHKRLISVRMFFQWLTELTPVLLTLG